MKALDLFCGAGGASRGLANAGFEVVGVDIEPQPNYPFPYWIADALDAEILSRAFEFDFIWASPPCQAFTAYKRRPLHVQLRANLIPKVREALKRTGKPWVIENVAGAPLEDPVMLCGSMFGLDVQRHRYFESNFKITQPRCDHSKWTARFAPATNRKNLRKTVEIGVWRIPLDVQQKAMGINWMNLQELSQAIPPAYSEFLAREFLQ